MRLFYNYVDIVNFYKIGGKIMKIEIIKETQYEETAKMIERSVRFSSFSKFYPQVEIENVVNS